MIVIIFYKLQIFRKKSSLSVYLPQNSGKTRQLQVTQGINRYKVIKNSR